MGYQRQRARRRGADPAGLDTLAAGARPSRVDKHAVVPLYHQVYERIRDGIVAGAYRPGERLPPERELCVRLGVSRITAQKAFERLVQEGLVTRHRGQGSRVALHPRVPAMSADMQALLDNVAVIAAATTGRLVELVEAVPEPPIRAALQLARGAKAQRSVHLRLRDGVPLGLIVTWVPLALAIGITAADIEQTPMITMLEHRGVRPAWAVQTIGATTADARAARLLDVTTGAPLVTVQRVVYDRRDRPIEHLYAAYRADRYEYRTVIRREAPRRRSESALARG